MRSRVLGVLAAVAVASASFVVQNPTAHAAHLPLDGSAAPQATTAGIHLDAPVVGMAATNDGRGYWLAAADGGVFSFGDAQFYGSMGGAPLNEPVVGIAATHDGKGYWLVAADGGVFSFGDAQFYGSMGGAPLNELVVGMAATNDGRGYWLVASDGGVFAFGDAAFSGSLGGGPPSPPNSRVVGMGAFPDDSHYWLVTSGGSLTVFGFGSGSWPTGWADLSTSPPNAPFVAVANWGTRSDFKGVWLEGADGGVFTLGGAPFYGSMGGKPLNVPVVGMAVTPSQDGYWLVAADGGVFAFGDAPFLGSAA